MTRIRAADNADVISRRLIEFDERRRGCICTTDENGERTSVSGCPVHPPLTDDGGMCGLRTEAPSKGLQAAALRTWMERIGRKERLRAPCTCKTVTDDYNGLYRVWARDCPEHTQ